MISFTHLLLIILVCVVIFGPNKLPQLGRSMRDSLNEFKKGLHGESDIDITDSVKRLDDD